jgi:hypothetical protein
VIHLDQVQPGEPMTLPTACQWLGQLTGRVPATSTMWRWCLKGVRGGIRLESFRVGGTTYVTPAMIQRFIEATSSSSKAAVAASSSATGIEGQADERRRQIADAQRRLADICKPRARGRRRPK